MFKFECLKFESRKIFSQEIVTPAVCRASDRHVLPFLLLVLSLPRQGNEGPPPNHAFSVRWGEGAFWAQKSSHRPSATEGERLWRPTGIPVGKQRSRKDR